MWFQLIECFTTYVLLFVNVIEVGYFNLEKNQLFLFSISFTVFLTDVKKRVSTLISNKTDQAKSILKIILMFNHMFTNLPDSHIQSHTKYQLKSS